MTLLILGLIFFLVGALALRRPSSLSPYARILRLGGLGLAVIGVLTACIVQIGAGEIGVQVLYGSVQNNVLPSGLHFINPLVNVVHMDTKTQNYTMSAIHNEGATDKPVKLYSVYVVEKGKPLASPAQ